MMIRPRRNRKTANLRDMVQENHLSVNDLIAPLFLIEGEKQKIEVASMPGQFRYSIDQLCEQVKKLEDLGVKSVCLFPAIDESLKDSKASESLNENGIYPRAINAVKETCPNIMIMTDVALDPYSSDGHDGIVQNGEILNDETLEILEQMAVVQAKAGADIIGPSDMMDGRVDRIRKALDKNNFKNVSIMSYSAKYASSFYGPFRDALDSAPKAGDKKTYQMNPANIKEAVREVLLDEKEGADIVMVKPGLPYLDVIHEIKNHTTLPVAAYNVSGEYAMIKAAAEKGWLDGEGAMMEMLLSFKRAGADLILTYFSEEAAKIFK